MKQFTIALFALALCLTGCKKAAPVAATGEKAVLNLYSWSEYFPDEVLKDFTAKTGIEVKATYYSSNEELRTKLSSGIADYDVVVPSDYTVQALILDKRLAPLDRAKLANFKNLDAKLLGLSYDKANAYSIPVFWGTTGLGVNKDVIKDPVDSWAVVFDEKNAGKIAMLNDGRENFAVALKLMGKSVNETDPAILKQAADKLRVQTKFVKAYDSDSFDEKLKGGDAALVHGYNGQLAKIVAEDPKKYAYVVPKEGATRWVDNLCIPAGAPHAGNAHLFLNFILEAKTAAAMTNKVRYASANEAAKAFVTPDVLKDENVYPPESVLSRCELMQDLGATAPVMDKMWAEIKAK